MDNVALVTNLFLSTYMYATVGLPYY